MARYLRVPESNIAGTIGAGIGKATGAIVTAGNKALDVIEAALAAAKESSVEIKAEVRSIRESALLEAAAKKSEAAAASIAGGGSSFTNFLSKLGVETAVTTQKVGKSASILQAEAAKIIEQANALIDSLVAKNNLTIRTTVREIDAKLAAIEATLSTILGVIKTLRAICNTLRIPVAALKAAILVIKALPIPQRWLVVSFTILESDMLEMMTELVVQVDEQIESITTVLDGIVAALEPLRERIQRIRASINVLDVDTILSEASASDLNVLDEAGLYDTETGDSLFDKIQDGNGSGTDRLPFGNIGDVDLSDPYIGNQVSDRDPGQTIVLPDSRQSLLSGSYLDDYYLWSRDEPKQPSSDPEGEGWERFPNEPNSRLSGDDLKLWKIQIPRTGDGKSFDDSIPRSPRSLDENEIRDLYNSDKDLQDFLKSGGRIGNDPNLLSGSVMIGVDPRGNRDGDSTSGLDGGRNGNVVGVSETGEILDSGNLRDTAGRKALREGKVLLLGLDNFHQKPGILKISNWDDLQNRALDKLKDLPLSKGLQDALERLKQREVTEKVGTSNLEAGVVAYRAANGELYYLRIVEDSKSPKVATRRYVEVTDAAGIHVLDGNKTFSLDQESLIVEMKLQLDLLTR